MYVKQKKVYQVQELIDLGWLKTAAKNTEYEKYIKVSRQSTFDRMYETTTVGHAQILQT